MNDVSTIYRVSILCRVGAPRVWGTGTTIDEAKSNAMLALREEYGPTSGRVSPFGKRPPKVLHLSVDGSPWQSAGKV